jgi:hypothetical protein
MANRQHESQAVQAATIFIVCPAVATIFVALRVYTRFFLTKRYFWEDSMIVAAMVWDFRSRLLQTYVSKQVP